MHDHRHGRRDRGRSGHDGRRDERSSGRDCDHERRGDGDAGRGGGPDTRFLELEMSRLLYAEAESVTRRAMRELLLEAAKARFQERFGNEINGLAELAVDELMRDVMANLEIEGRIHERNRERDRTDDRLRDILGKGGEGASEDREDREDRDDPDSERDEDR